MKRSIAISASALGAGLFLALASPLSASAHVSIFEASSTAAGSTSVLTFSVGHGCEGSATTSIAISIPDSIPTAQATVNPNWTVSRVADGERTSQVVYTAITPLDADNRDTFQISVALIGAEGDVLEFPTLQTCEVGETLWAGDEAPTVTLTAAVEGEDDHHAAAPETEHVDAVDSADALARVLGILGLVVGAVGIVIGVTARRRA